MDLPLRRQALFDSLSDEADVLESDEADVLDSDDSDELESDDSDESSDDSLDRDAALLPLLERVSVT